MDLYKVTGILDRKGWHIESGVPLPCTETEKNFAAAGFIMTKDLLGVVQTKFHERPGLYMYHVYCTGDGIDDAKTALRDKISKRFEDDLLMMEEINANR